MVGVDLAPPPPIEPPPPDDFWPENGLVCKEGCPLIGFTMPTDIGIIEFDQPSCKLCAYIFPRGAHHLGCEEHFYDICYDCNKPYSVGTLVLISGLERRADLNNQTGIVTGPLSRGRLPILPLRGWEVVKVRLYNLTTFTTPTTSPQKTKQFDHTSPTSPTQWALRSRSGGTPPDR